MADGSAGGVTGVLFEAGKAISDAGKKQAQQVANTAAGQLGAQKPLFGGTQKQPTSGSFTPKAGTGGQMPKLDPFGDLSKMFEGGSPGLGAKKPQMSSAPQFTQADLDRMAAENNAKDQQEIAKRQAELHELQMQHKQLHDEVYYNDIKNAGQNAIARERKEKEQQVQQEEAQKQQQQQVAQQQEVMPGSPLAKNQQLGTPIAVTQAKTQTEINRGTTG